MDTEPAPSGNAIAAGNHSGESANVESEMSESKVSAVCETTTKEERSNITAYTLPSRDDCQTGR